MEGEGLKEIIEDVRIEDRNHFEALLPRIYELGGELPRDIREFADIPGNPDAYWPDSLKGGKDPTGPSLNGLLMVLVEAELCAVRCYTDLCQFTHGKDFRTFDICIREQAERRAGLNMSKPLRGGKYRQTRRKVALPNLASVLPIGLHPHDRC